MKTNKIFRRNLWIGACLGLLCFFQQPAYANPVSITLLHTNDLHSHFRPEKGPLGLGGVGRLKTKVDQLRAEIPNTLLVDGGDWSEGSIYYTDGAGTDSLNIMDMLGYDVAAIGNHDWLNGPDNLLDSLNKVNIRTRFVSANLSTDDYKRGAEFNKRVVPYVIREIAGVKIAFFGLSTYELIYDKYFSPVKIQEPFGVARELSEELKQKADVVVLISHNKTLVNRGILKAAPSIDLIIGAHDHTQLNHPIEVNRWGADPGWIVETGCWGRYLGRVDFTVDDQKQLKLVNYKLIQMDSSIPEDPIVLDKIQEVEWKLENRFGNILRERVAKSDFELRLDGIESTMGDLVADSILKSTDADFALNSDSFVYNAFHKGQIKEVDVFNAIPAIYNPSTRKTWTVKTLPLSGNALKWILNIVYSTQKVSAYGPLSVAGLRFTFDPLFLKTQGVNPYEPYMLGFSRPGEDQLTQVQSMPVAKNILIQGQPLNSDKVYKVALGQGIVDAIEFLNSYYSNLIPLDGLVDSGIENWKAIANYIRGKTLTAETASVGNRIQTLQADLGVHDYDVTWKPIQRTPHGMKAKVSIRVKNYGAKDFDSEDSLLHLLANQNGTDSTLDPHYQDLGAAVSIPKLASGESTVLNWEVELPEQKNGYYNVTVRIDGPSSEVNQTNNEVTHWFTQHS